MIFAHKSGTLAECVILNQLFVTPGSILQSVQFCIWSVIFTQTKLKITQNTFGQKNEKKTNTSGIR